MHAINSLAFTYFIDDEGKIWCSQVSRFVLTERSLSLVQKVIYDHDHILRSGMWRRSSTI